MSDTDRAEIAPSDAREATVRLTRLSTDDLAHMLRMRSNGKTYKEIAQRYDLPLTTIYRHLSRFEDRREMAREYLQGQSLRLAVNVARRGKASDHVAILKGVGVLAPDASAQVAVVIGPATGAPALDVPSFDVGRPTVDVDPTE